MTTNDNQVNFVDEYSLFATKSWTLNYHFTSPLALSLYNTPKDIESCQSRLHKLTSAITKIISPQSD